METASQRLRVEMERSADEIIARLGTHIDHLEDLVAEADRRTQKLEQMLEEVKQREAHLMALEEEQLHSFAAGAAAMVPGRGQEEAFADLLEDSLGVEDSVDRSLSADQYHYHDDEAEEIDWETDSLEEPEVFVAASVADVAHLPMTMEEAAWAAEEEDERAESYGYNGFADEAAVAMEPIMEPILPPEEAAAEYAGPVDAERAATFTPPVEMPPAAESETSADGSVPGAVPEPAPALPQPQPVAPMDEEALGAPEDAMTDEEETDALAAGPEEDFLEEPLPEAEDSLSRKAREMLAQGVQAADVARELQLGRGAIDLIAQMEKNKVEKH